MACLFLLACGQEGAPGAEERAPLRGSTAKSRSARRGTGSSLGGKGEAIRPELFKRRVASYDDFLTGLLNISPEVIATSRYYGDIVDHLNCAIEELTGSRHDQDTWMITYGQLRQSAAPMRSSRAPPSTRSTSSTRPPAAPAGEAPGAHSGASSTLPSARPPARPPARPQASRVARVATPETGGLRDVMQALPGFASRDASSYVLATDLLRQAGARLRQHHPIAEMLFWVLAEQLQLCRQWIEAGPLWRDMAELRRRLREAAAGIEETQQEIQLLSERLVEAEGQRRASEAEAARLSSEIGAVSARVASTANILDSAAHLRAQWSDDRSALEANLSTLAGDSFMVAFAFTVLSMLSPQERGYHLLQLSALLRDEMALPLSQVWLERHDIDTRIILQLISGEDLMALQYMVLASGLINATADFTERDAVLALTSAGVPLHPPPGAAQAEEPLPPLAEGEWTSLLNAFGNYCGLEACVIEHGRQMVEPVLVFALLASLFSTRATAVLLEGPAGGAGAGRELGQRFAELCSCVSVLHGLIPQERGEPFRVPLIFSNLEEIDEVYGEVRLPLLTELQAAPGEVSFLDARLDDLTLQLNQRAFKETRAAFCMPLTLYCPAGAMSEIHTLCRGAHAHKDGIYYYQLAERPRTLATLSAPEVVLVESSRPLKPTVLVQLGPRSGGAGGTGGPERRAPTARGAQVHQQAPGDPAGARGKGTAQLYGAPEDASREETNAFLRQVVHNHTLSFMTLLPLPSQTRFMTRAQGDDRTGSRGSQSSEQSFNSFGEESSDSGPGGVAGTARAAGAGPERPDLGAGQESGRGPSFGGFRVHALSGADSRRHGRAEARLAQSTRILRILRSRDCVEAEVTPEIAEYTCDVFRAMYTLSVMQGDMLRSVADEGGGLFSSAISLVNTQMRRVAFLLARLKKHMLCTARGLEEE